VQPLAVSLRRRPLTPAVIDRILTPPRILVISVVFCADLRVVLDRRLRRGKA